MTIKRILTVLFPVMLLLCLGQGGLTQMKLDSTAQRTAELLDNAIPSMNEANVINTLVIRTRPWQFRYMTAENEAAKAESAAKVVEFRRDRDAKIEAYRALIASPEEQRDAIDGIGARIREIADVAASIAAAVEEQGAATQGIVRNVAQAASGTEEVTATITCVAGAAEATAAASAQVLASSSELSRQSVHLTSEVGRFLAAVRAA
ncbi:hypothetical protein ASF53_13625 [Methylobacterium sp. Leaf123]|uniref:MCP four helix bundle domain-containing protein n=1 Tax=Methylobacterium sp. Leaf123 TaxID=1736264 RepID=UPI0006F79C9A|nr:MCP four helix bundle domain-containing protein [Methylobacterium sp. Leaf123]KQQ13221.1 hypothetical protein ASF53_13625 [Methylobacterium sp. Leaf123]